MKDIVWKKEFDKKKLRNSQSLKEVTWSSEDAKEQHDKDHVPEKKKSFSLVKKVKPTFLKPKKKIREEQRAVVRSFIFPGAIVKLVKTYSSYLGYDFCTIVQERRTQKKVTDDINGWSKYWTVAMPDGSLQDLPSAAFRPIVTKNGNSEENS